MRVAAQVIEHLCGAAKRWFRVDDPLRVNGGREPGGERSRLPQRLELAMEAQRAGVERAAQLVEKEPPEEPREHPHGQEETRSAGDPALAGRGNAAARYHAVDVRMVQQVLPPRVQDREEADLRARVFRIGGDRAQRRSAGAEQQIVEDLLVLVRECRDGFGQREDDMEVLNVGQQFGLPALEPLRAGERLALRTAAMPA